MKKLKLSELNFGHAEVLTTEQLKKISGGLLSGMCYAVIGNEGDGHVSCWYSTEDNSGSLCDRVYPSDPDCTVEKNQGTGQCDPGCHMN